MISDDTNELTIKLLVSKSYFGMDQSQVKILKQVCSIPSSFLNAYIRKTFFYICVKHTSLLSVLVVHIILFFRKK
jgi:hypothetical protein